MNEVTKAIAPIIGLGLIGQYIENALDIVVGLEDQVGIFLALRQLQRDVLAEFNNAEDALFHLVAPTEGEE